MLLRNTLDSSLTILDISPQAHGAIIVAFHLEVFRVSLFIFFQRKAFDYESSMQMNLNNHASKYTNAYNRGQNSNSMIVDTHLAFLKG
jgi:hypothetical protein